VNLGITDQAVATIFRFTEIGTIDDLWTLEIPTDLWRTSVENITSIFKLAQAYGIDKWLSYDGSIVRGLSYYDGIVFEGFFRGKEFKKALLGGGRYNNLTEQYKKSCKMSGVGFGMGDIVIAQVLAATGKIPNLARSVPYCVGAYNEDFFPIALDIARGLRASGQKVDVCAKTGMGPVLTYASKIGANSAIIVTPSEWAQGQVLVKNLTTGVQTSTPVGDLSLA
jgi:histidyl-tRNA synthetase